MKLTQARTSPDQTHNAASACNTSRANKDDFETEKLKASNFPASLLKIGSWEVKKKHWNHFFRQPGYKNVQIWWVEWNFLQRISRYEGDLVAKCYYAKKKIVWEVLDGALKSKIEVQWSDIEAIRATIVDDQPGILEIEVKDLNLYLTNNLYLFFFGGSMKKIPYGWKFNLVNFVQLNQPPQFFRETNPQPRKHTLWHPASDFTGGQAPTFRYKPFSFCFYFWFENVVCSKVFFFN